MISYFASKLLKPSVYSDNSHVISFLKFPSLKTSSITCSFKIFSSCRFFVKLLIIVNILATFLNKKKCYDCKTTLMLWRSYEIQKFQIEGEKGYCHHLPLDKYFLQLDRYLRCSDEIDLVHTIWLFYLTFPLRMCNDCHILQTSNYETYIYCCSYQLNHKKQLR